MTFPNFAFVISENYLKLQIIRPDDKCIGLDQIKLLYLNKRLIAQPGKKY